MLRNEAIVNELVHYLRLPNARYSEQRNAIDRDLLAFTHHARTNDRESRF